VYLDRLASEVSVSEVTTYYVGIFISLEHFVTLSTFKQFKTRYKKYYRRLESGVSHHLHNHLLGRPTLVGKALSFTDELSFVFLSIHRAQQPGSGWPSNVFRRFGRR